MAILIRAAPEPISIEPGRTAVLVVDMQNDFGSPGGMFDLAGIDIQPIRKVIEPTSRVLVGARRAGLRIVYLKMEFESDLSNAGSKNSPNFLKHQPLRLGDGVKAPDGSDGRILIKGTWNTRILPEVTPEPDDIVVSKHRYSGFYETDLDAILKGFGVKTLVFTGCTTSVCVESTLRDAAYRDYTCLLLSDCVAEPIGNNLPRSNHDATLLVTQVLFGWVSESTSFLRALDTVSAPARA